MSTTSGCSSAAAIHSFGAVTGLADDLNIGLIGKYHAKACPDELLIVGDHDAYRHVVSPRIPPGSRARR